VAFNGDFEKMGSEEMNQISFLLRMKRIVDMTIFMYTSKVYYILDMNIAIMYNFRTNITLSFAQVIRQYSQFEVLPWFAYMSHLHVTLSISLLNWLPIFLESCTELKSLVLVMIYLTNEFLFRL